VSEENVERLRSIYAEWALGNVKVGADLYAPDAVFEPIADGRESLDRAGFERFMREFLAQWDGFESEAEDFRDLGDKVLVTERQRATGKSSGIEIDMTAYAIWTFRDGLVARVRWEIDWERAEEAAGLAN
jgi:ketosteroid isomerase-like protein